MAHDTIPAPTEHHIQNARIALAEITFRHSNVAAQRAAAVDIIAQLQAEVDWLHSLIQRGV